LKSILAILIGLTGAAPLSMASAAPLALAPASADSTPIPVYHDAGVEVTASRFGLDERLNVSNITTEDLARREPDQELPMLVQSLPGVFSYSDAGNGTGYTYLKVRGFDQRRVGVLLNGIPLNDPEDHQVWWVDLPDLAADVQDIQLQRGVTGSVGGMTAIGGTVDVVTTPPGQRPGTRVALDFGSYGFARQMMAWDSGRLDGGWSAAVRLSRQESDGYRDRSGYDGWAVTGSVRRETERTINQVNVKTGRELTHHAWDAVPESLLRVHRTANLETYHNAVDDFTQPHFQWHNTWLLGEGLTLVNRFYHVRGDGFYENYRADETAGNYGLDLVTESAFDDETDLIRRKWVAKRHTGWVPSLTWEQGRGRLVVGGDAYTFHSDHWGEVLWSEGLTPDAYTTPWRYHDYTGDKDAWSLYADQQWQLGSGLLATVNLQYQQKRYRFAQHEAGNFSGERLNAYTVVDEFFNPKGALDWTVPGQVAGGSLQFYANAGINHREPTDNELFDTWSGGDDLDADPLFAARRDVPDGQGGVSHVEWTDPLVKPERVVDRELGLGWRGRGLEWTLGGYWMDFTDEIVAYGGVSDDGSGIRGNAGKTRHRGLELSVRARLGEAHAVALAASRSWDEAVEFIFHDWAGSVYDYAGNPLALFPSHLAMASWDGGWGGGLRSRVRVRSTGGQQLDNSGDEARTIAPWTTIDLSLWLDLREAGLFRGSEVTVFAHLRNIGDVEYETWGYWYGENYYTPAAGRNVAVGIDCGF
jgi:iron complex outermembrane receptor protein